MKTTINIADPLLQEAKSVAVRDDTTLRALIEEGLRLVLDQKRTKGDFHLRDASFRGRGLRPELAEAPWERLRDLSYEGRGS